MTSTNLDETLGALADPTRRQVIEMLRDRPHRAGELVEAFDVSAPAISRHLRVLRTRGLIEEERDPEDARLRIYKLRREPFADLSAWIQEVEAFWTDQLASFKAYAEGRDRAGDPEGLGRKAKKAPKAVRRGGRKTR